MTLVRFLHLAGIAVFAGGQIVLAVAIAPVLRGQEPHMRQVARRFGMASAAALGVIVVTGAVLASHLERWDDPVLHAKLGVLLAVFVLTGLHVARSSARALQLALLAATLVVLWLGVRLAHG